MRIYLSGPMSGMHQYNRAAFVKAAKELRREGLDVVSPVELDEADGASLDDPSLPERYWHFLSRDVQTIGTGNFDAMFVLEGWEKSVGARLEVFQAVLMRIPVYNKKWHNEYPEARKYHWGHHFNLDVF